MGFCPMMGNINLNPIQDDMDSRISCLNQPAMMNMSSLHPTQRTVPLWVFEVLGFPCRCHWHSKILQMRWVQSALKNEGYNMEHPGWGDVHNLIEFVRSGDLGVPF